MKIDGTKIREILVFIFGRYSPPGFLLRIVDGFKTGRIQSSLAGFFRAVGGFLKKRWYFFAAGGLVVLLGLGGLLGYRIWKAHQPQLVPVDSYMGTPGPTNYETGEVSSLTIHFYGSAARLDLAGKPVTEGAKIEPEIPGAWSWSGDDTLVFKPEQDWTIGETYSVTLDKLLFADHVTVEQKYRFTIPPFSITVGSGEFYIDPENPQIKRVLFTLSSNYPIDAESLSSRISLKPDLKANSGQLVNREYSVTVSYNKNYTTAYLVSEAIGIPRKDVSMKLTLGKGVQSSRGGKGLGVPITSWVSVPGATGYVRVEGVQHQLVKTPDQMFDQVFVVETRGEVSIDDLKQYITVYQLPKDRPEMPGLERSVNHHWGALDELTPAIIEKSTRLTPVPLPGERKYEPVNSFRFKAEPGRYVYVKVDKGVKFWGGYYLEDEYQSVFRVQEYPKEISILSEGTILSMTGSRKLSLLSRGVPKVQYRIGRIRPDDVNHLVTQSYGDLPALQFSGYRFGEYNITEQYHDEASIPVGDPRKAEFFSFDFSRYLDTLPEKNLRYGLFFFEVKGKDNYSGYSDRRLIMVTDLGIVVKGNMDKSRELYVQSIADGTPVAGAQVRILGVNGNPVVTGYTDGEGHLTIPAINTYSDKAPTVYVVTKGNDMAFMPYDDTPRKLDFSGFDVGGVYGVTDPRTLTAFLFSDRGLYRPGDEMRIGMIIKAGDWNINLSGTPLEYRITDSRGAEVLTRQITLSSSGFEEFRYRTQEYSPTGAYVVSLYLIKEKENNRRVFLGSTEVKVEEFLPDNLTIETAWGSIPREGWNAPKDILNRVSVRNLFGSAAVGNTVKAQIFLNPGYGRFREYQDWTFFDPFRKDKSYEEFLGEVETDKEGSAEFNIDLARFEKATYTLRFYAEAYEKGSGRSVSRESVMLVSPLDYLVGWKSDGDLSFINKGSERNVSFLAINPELKKTAVKGLTLTLSEIRFVSILVKQPNGLYKYQSVRKVVPMESRPLDISGEGVTLPLETGRAGDFQITLSDAAENVFADFGYSVIGSENQERSLDRTAELSLQLNKGDFQTGEEIELFIKAPYAGSGLITIERDKVYTHKWFRTDTQSSTQRIRVPEGLEGNGYVTVMFLRDADSREIYMSPLCYGTAAFSVSRENRTNAITLDIPHEAKPGRDYKIGYKTARPGKILIFAVDEGILQVARYRTPDPLGHFFQKRALEVYTSQILDLVLPDFAVVQSLAAMGGGGDAEFLSRNLNPFRRKQKEPVAYWSGILNSGPEGGTVTYKVPDHFNGTLRVMAISVSADSLGAAEDSAIIRDTYTIKPNSPMAAAPGDEFEVSVLVANNRRGSGPDARIDLTIVPSANLSVVAKPEMPLVIPEGEDRSVSYTVRAGSDPGAAELTFTATGGGESSRISDYLSVRPPIPYRVSVKTGVVRSGKIDVPVDRSMHPDFRTLDVSCSYLPLGMARGLNFYLSTYPYGCTEQIISAAFPHLYTQLMGNLEITPAASRETVIRTIGILQARQKSHGGFGLWTSESASYTAIDVYAAHFLLTAREKGYFVPDSLMDNTLNNLKNIAGGTSSGWVSLTHKTYAVYILTLSGVITTPYLERIRKDLESGYKDWETSYPGLFLAGTYALLQQKSEGNRLMGKIKRQFKRDGDYIYFDELCFTSLYLTIVSRHYPQRLKDVSEELLTNLAGYLESQRFTTFSANYALMGVDNWLRAVPTSKTGKYQLTEIAVDKSEKALKAAGDPIFSAGFSPSASRIRIENRDLISLFWQVTMAGFDLKLPEKEEKHGLELFREYLDGSGSAKADWKLGDDVKVRIRFRTPDGKRVQNVAIVDILPSGFEPDIPSIREGLENGQWRPDYVDIREDRVIIFGTVTGDMQEFSYKVRAINKGKFVVPPIFGEAMYDRETWAIRPQVPVTITQ